MSEVAAFLNGDSVLVGARAGAGTATQQPAVADFSMDTIDLPTALDRAVIANAI